MKILLTSIFGTLLLLTTMSTTSINLPNKVETSKKELKFAVCKFGQCKGTAKSTGRRCKHCVSKSGDKYCYQHR